MEIGIIGNIKLKHELKKIVGTGELKPCRFCESKAVITHSNKGFQIFCENEDCILNDLKMYNSNTEDEAIKIWNRIAEKELEGVEREEC